MQKEIPPAVFIAVIVIVLLLVAFFVWRASGPKGEVVLEKAAKPYPAPPIFKQPPPK